MEIKITELAPRKFKAAILVEQNRPLVVDEVELPSHLGIGQVLVQLTCSGICGSQLGEIAGAKGPDPYLPHLLGHEAHGVIRQVGPGVRHVKDNQSVVLHWRKGIGEDSLPPRYQWKGKVVNAGWITTFNSWAIVSANRVTPVDSALDPEVASLFGCAVTTGLGVVENNARVRLGETVLVYGAGGVGLNIIQGAAMAGASKIVAIDRFDNRLEMAKSMGADVCINNSRGGLENAQLQREFPQGLDVAIDNTGNPVVIQQLYELTKATGRVVLVGVPKKGESISIYSLPLHFGKSISGSHGGESSPNLDIPRYLSLHSAGKLQLKNLITMKFDLSDINTALDKMRSGEMAGRCMIYF